jgi:hypothetical protein
MSSSTHGCFQEDGSGRGIRSLNIVFGSGCKTDQPSLVNFRVHSRQNNRANADWGLHWQAPGSPPKILLKICPFRRKMFQPQGSSWDDSLFSKYSIFQSYARLEGRWCSLWNPEYMWRTVLCSLPLFEKGSFNPSWIFLWQHLKAN